MTEDDVLDTATALYALAHGEHIGGKTQAVARIQLVLQQIIDAESLVSRSPSVAGCTSQSDDKVALVNEFKQDEERLLRKIDGRQKDVIDRARLVTGSGLQAAEDMRWLAIAQTHFQEGFMALNRAVFQPQRVRLPEDEQ